MIIRLKCIEGARKGEEFVVKEGIIIGRTKGDLQLRDAKASSTHAKIYSDNNDIPFIEDLKSSNGTSVNGAKITKPTKLQIGDRITIGKSTLVLELVTPKGKEPESEKGSWQEHIERALDEALLKAEKKAEKS